MITRARIIATLIALAQLGTAVPGLACGLDYRDTLVSSVDAAGEADLILVAKVESGPRKWNFDHTAKRRQLMVVRPITAIKGGLPGTRIELHGLVSPAGSKPPSTFPLCNGAGFVQGELGLFFLKRDGDVWNPLVADEYFAWSRPVRSLSDPMITAARLYVRLAGLPKEQRTAATSAERDSLLASADARSRAVGEILDEELRHIEWWEQQPDPISTRTP